MKYRKFGKLDWKVSTLGFGAMRLPLIDDDQTKIDETEATKMIRHSIDQGVNYVDTAYTYHGGNSERLLGQILEDGYREKIKLATKFPSWFAQSPDDFDRYLNEQLERLRTDRIEFYLLHGLSRNSWPKLRDWGVLKWAEGAIRDGRIDHLGFSFHDDYELFEEIINAYDNWTLCQIQYNFMDIEFQAGTKGLKHAAGKGIAVVIMEPLRGGKLAQNPPQQVSSIWNSAGIKRTPAEWALLWLWNQPEVTLVLSGMTTMRHVQENLASADKAFTESLGTEEMDLIDKVRQEYRRISPIPCTNCRYCTPCPNGVNIPRILELYNSGYMYDDHRRSRFIYRTTPPDQQADNCIQCGECEEACPQNIEIVEWLEKAHGWLGPKKT